MTDGTMDSREITPAGDSTISSTKEPEEVVELIYKRPKKARRSVVVADRVADWTITVGGLAVIFAVFGIMIFLVEEVLPLFQGGKLLSKVQYPVSIPAGAVSHLTVDEHHTVVVALMKDGRLSSFHAATGTPLEAPSLDFSGKEVTAIGATPDRENFVFGFADGTARLGYLKLRVEILTQARLPADLKKLNERDSSDGQSVYSAVTGSQIRRVWVEAGLQDGAPVSPSGSPIVALDYRTGGMAERQTRSFVALDSRGDITLNMATSRLNLLTSQTQTTITTSALPQLPKPHAEIAQVLMTSAADQVYVADRDGRVYRYNTRSFDKPSLAEVLTVLPEGVNLTVFRFLLGEQSLMVGGADGSLRTYYFLATHDGKSQDGYSLIHTRTFESQDAALKGFDASLRDKTFVTADLKGNVWVRHGTSEQTLLRLKGEPGGYDAVILAPRADGVLALGGSSTEQVNFWNISIPHPETSWHTLFGKVWYEGYHEPTYTWQSSAATDEFEPKLSLVPLIFGTIKATLYSLLFAVPIALLGAIYTSEFLHHRIRAVIKPIIELMASLPSVVLGFVAALVLAPVVETWIAAVLLVFFVLPASMVGAAYVWQFVPSRLALRLQGVPKFALMFAVVCVGVWLAYIAGPAFERAFFGGDFRLWVNGTLGGAAPFLSLLLMPFTLIVVSMATGRLYGKSFKVRMRQASEVRAAWLSAFLAITNIVMAAVVAYGVAWLLQSWGVDARGTIFNTYVQRNSLVVGFAMGFAVIPIIYTLAEDALNAVPEHLRAASLGCGATTWQTAIWVVLPTAVSGVFSAIMIGMGRAVGETMIVVMATGNTPIIDWNIFNGLRALSANIAVELPEAVKDGTLYRVLFLAGLVLFSMTFVINTLAEIIRQRFRKRAQQL